MQKNAADCISPIANQATGFFFNCTVKKTDNEMNTHVCQTDGKAAKKPPKKEKEEKRKREGKERACEDANAKPKAEQFRSIRDDSSACNASLLRVARGRWRRKNRVFPSRRASFAHELSLAAKGTREARTGSRREAP